MLCEYPHLERLVVGRYRYANNASSGAGGLVGDRHALSNLRRWEARHRRTSLRQGREDQWLGGLRRVTRTCQLWFGALAT